MVGGQPTPIKHVEQCSDVVVSNHPFTRHDPGPFAQYPPGYADPSVRDIEKTPSNAAVRLHAHADVRSTRSLSSSVSVIIA